MATKAVDCDCGFIDADEPTGTTFPSLLVVDFATATLKELEEIFIISSYNVTQSDAPFTRDFEADQVQLTSAGLELTVSPAIDGQIVPSASIFTRSDSFLFGSYRAKVLVGDIPGTVTAFYNYHNDTSEVDIEYVSARAPALLYSVKPQIYFASGNPDSSTYQIDTWNDTAASFDQNFHEWSFTWLPDIVHFGLDAHYSKTITTNVPQAPGTVVLSHWSNGNPRYSAGPPSVNSTVTFSLLQAVYNDANATTPACKIVTSPCVVRDGALIFDGMKAGSNSSTTESSIPVNALGAVTRVNSNAAVTSPVAPLWAFVLTLCLLLR